MEIIYTDEIVFGEKQITSIKVLPLNYVQFAKIWGEAQSEVVNNNGATLIQRKRIMLQAQFMSGTERVKPEIANIMQIPLRAARSIIAALDEGEGARGTLLNDGDGISSPVHYKLGTPLSITVNKQNQQITEIEFSAKTYGDVEDVLAIDGNVLQALELIRRCAKPVDLDSNITTLPSWAVDRITTADGITIMQQILPRFLE